jgi:valyl-tRNA synthetase
MKSIELAKSYNPKSFEDRIYSLWNEKGAFRPKDSGGQPFVIVIPPPNVTGILHLGHALVTSIIDTVIRYHRMKGDSALWVPGTDHAGIATQHVVEKKLGSKGLKRHDLGRENFIKETWKVKEEHHSVITKQQKRMGASVDWDRERFTMDEGLSRAVREVFVSLYERDLLYKGNYLVNWCCSCGTALSDDEVEHEDTAGVMYHLRYPFKDSSGYIEIATTRPETMLGDTAVAVHPQDERYLYLKGKTLMLPLADREIPLIFDSYVDREFGTGALKITPAHDPNDWDVAKRHGLQIINILLPDGSLNESVPEKYRGLNVKDARERILEDLKAGGFYVREEAISHSIGHCYRCNSVIEPYLSEQWFVRMKPLAEKALACWRNGDVIFYPKKWENTYQHWLENIRDWCISRQLWWGHRIPAWYCKDCGKTSVSRNDIAVCPHCGSANIEQDPDVLDTWFSSWLWPFSALGWEKPSESCPDLERFYPTTALVTAYDIIFFWVARMIMAGLEFTGKSPFRDVYLHQLIRDKHGRKMSKSLGNGIDPLEIVDEYGADSLRFTLDFLCAQGQDILIDKEYFKIGSKFANKIWNASRYILMNLEGRNLVKNPALLEVDKWIYSRLNGTAKTVEEAFLSYRFNDAAQAVYEYFWNDFCDWYVEATKLSLKSGDDNEKDRAVTVLLDLLALSLRLAHPLLPFVTEEIYSRLPNVREGELLITAQYPQYSESRSFPETEKNFAVLQTFVGMIRTMRGECGITAEKKLCVLVSAGMHEGVFIENDGMIKLLAGIGELKTEKIPARPEGSIGLAGNGFEAFVFIDRADTAALKAKLSRDLERDTKFLNGLRQKLGNEQFIKNAPAELVAQEKMKLDETVRRTEKLESYIRDL